MKSLGQRATGARLERMQASPRWAGEGFRNVFPVPPGLRDGSVRPSLSDFICGGERRVPPGPFPVVQPGEVWTRDPQSGLRATWLGHSSVLLEIDGHRVLTDPVWGPRASPSRIAGPKRFQPPPVPLKQVPTVDAVVVSHDHYDHLDYPTIRALSKYTNVPFVTSLGVGAHLQSWGVAPERITELDWWETHRIPGTGLTVTAAPSQHFSGRGLKDRNATLWSSMVMRGPNHSVFFSGDTGLTTEYTAIRDRLGPFDLVMLEVGAYHPSWGDIHLGPDNALKAYQLLGGGAFLPVHWGTFNLSMHAWDQPVERLLELAPAFEARLVMPRLGEAVEPGRVEGVEAWWRGVGATAATRRKATITTVEQAPPDSAAAATMPWPLD